MEELNRAYEALQKAHDAGDVEGAQRIAEYARSLETQQIAPKGDTIPEQRATLDVMGIEAPLAPMAGAITGASLGALASPAVSGAVDTAAVRAAQAIAPGSKVIPGDVTPQAVKNWLATQTSQEYAGGDTYAKASRKAKIAAGEPIESRGANIKMRRGNLGISNQPPPATLPQQAATSLLNAEKVKAPGIGRRVAGMGIAGAEAGKAIDEFDKGNYGRSTLAALGALSGAASQSRIKPLRALGTIGSMVIPGVQTMLPEEPQPEMARGGLVHLKKGGEPEFGEARAYEPSYSEKIRDYAAKYMSPERADVLFGGPRASTIDEFNPIGVALRTPGVLADSAAGFLKAGQEGNYLAGMGNFFTGAANAAPLIGPGKQVAKTAVNKLGPKAAEMAENYLTKIGGIQHIVPPGQKPAHEIGASAPTKMSDFMQDHIGKYLVPTQSDRMAGVGGPSYSANQLALPQYAGRTWGSGQQATATGITNLAKDPRFGGTENQIFSPLLGDPQMHISNQLAFDAVKDAFYKNKKNLTPEQRVKINEFMRSGGTSLGAKQKFDPIPGFEIADQDMINELGKSFSTRGLIGKHAFGGKDLGGKKAQIVPFDQMLLEMQDPNTIGAKTFSVGPRAFSLSGEVENVPRPDLNSAFPVQLLGKDYGVNLKPVPSELSLMDFGAQWRKDTGNMAPKKSGELPNPGYFEHTLGYKPPGSSERVYPRQQATEEWIKELQRSGFAKGGLATLKKKI